MKFRSDLSDGNDLIMATVKNEDLNDVYKSIAGQIGFENIIVIYNMFRGTQVSFPNRMFSIDYIV